MTYVLLYTRTIKEYYDITKTEWVYMHLSDQADYLNVM